MPICDFYLFYTTWWFSIQNFHIKKRRKKQFEKVLEWVQLGDLYRAMPVKIVLRRRHGHLWNILTLIGLASIIFVDFCTFFFFSCKSFFLFMLLSSSDVSGSQIEDIAMLFLIFWKIVVIFEWFSSYVSVAIPHIIWKHKQQPQDCKYALVHSLYKY